MAEERTAVSSTASLPMTPPAAAYQTLATPANWPSLLLFCSTAKLVNGAAGGLLRKGATVEEFAGLVPPLGAQLTWECRVADARRGTLMLDALDYPGPASDVELCITVRSDGGSGSTVEIGASFLGDGPLGAVVGPALGVEFALSTALLFPAQFKP